ncbi:MAG: hypothetical protein ACW96U_12480 [Candidatus Heimdallarchaeaceae archaeon]|jgi:hypothetical protein
MEYEKFIKSSLEYKNAREQRSKDASHDALLKNTKKKIQTTMIGSLSDIEEFFGFLWNFGQDDTELTEEQKYMKSIYEDARAKILDRGNTQIRDLELEFINYEISRKKYYIKLPVAKPKGEENDG